MPSFFAFMVLSHSFCETELVSRVISSIVITTALTAAISGEFEHASWKCPYRARGERRVAAAGDLVGPLGRKPDGRFSLALIQKGLPGLKRR